MPIRATEAAAQGRSRWDARIVRARALATDVPAATEILTFYSGLATCQRAMLDRLPADWTDGADRPFRDSLEIDPALAAIPDLLAWLAAHGPDALARRAAGLRDVRTDDWRDAMREYVADEVEPAVEDQHVMAFVVASALQPFAECLAIQRRAALADRRPSDPGGDGTTATCPVCDGPPVVGVLREEGHGGRRGLVCRFCLQERNFLRVICPACGEQKFDALPVYTTDAFAHVRIDACDTCRVYLKTIDLTKDGLAVPIVDDLATVTLDLWARERGYTRLAPNLLLT